jgi:hypothetical protein
VKVDFGLALRRLDRHIETSSFPPALSELIQPEPMTDYLRILKEREGNEDVLLLEEYHGQNEVVPMPPEIAQQIAKARAEMRSRR